MTELEKKARRRFVNRIEHEFDRCQYIGDISVSDEEYMILMQILKTCYKEICSAYTHEINSYTFAVALVQIGIRHYDGRFWYYVKKELEVSNLPANHQSWIGNSFYNTLRSHNKHVVGQNQFVNNILLHCFVTEHYAGNLFDFLFAYYQLDLDRDLRRNNGELRNSLISAIQSGENTARAYMIRKHTADAVSVNDRGCRIRITGILKLIDDALFNDRLPINSKNRIKRYFCKWASESEKFKIEKTIIRGGGARSEKQFRSPYIRFDGKKDRFVLAFPQQHIILRSTETIDSGMWCVKRAGTLTEYPATIVSTVTGCLTERSEQELPPDYLFDELHIELIINGISRQRWKIDKEDVRFFDHDWDQIRLESGSRILSTGQAYAITDQNNVISSIGDVIFDSEIKKGMRLYNLILHLGDVIFLPNRRVVTVGHSMEEGILSKSLVSGASVIEGDSQYDVYSSFPLFYFRTTVEKIPGTLISLNGERIRLTEENCAQFDLDEQTDEKGYLLHLENNGINEGIEKIIIDIPNDKKVRCYSFAVIKNFDYHFDKSLYVFCDKGTIEFPTDLKVSDPNDGRQITKADFDILASRHRLPYDCITGDNRRLRVEIDIPFLSWKFDNDEWNVSRPDAIWHQELPKVIHFDCPASSITLSMPPLVQESLDDSDGQDEEQAFSCSFNADRETNIIHCDTRKILSWLGKEDPYRILSIDFGFGVMEFVSIITRCYLEKAPVITEDIQKGMLKIKSFVGGFSHCSIDVFFESEEDPIVEKMEVTTGGCYIKAPLRSGRYRIDYYEFNNDEEDDFDSPDGSTYYEFFDSQEVIFTSQYDFSGKDIVINRLERKKSDDRIFSVSYSLQKPLRISNITAVKDSPLLFNGTATIDGKTQRLQIHIFPNQINKAFMTFYSEEDDEYMDLLFDIEDKKLIMYQPKGSRNDRYELVEEDVFFYNYNTIDH